MIPRRKVNSYSGIFKDVIATFLKGAFLKGKCVSEFEEKFRGYLKINNAIAVPSGRFGMKLLLKAFHLSKGDEVILPAYTYYALPKVIIDLGYKPVFVDIEMKSYGINPELILQKITPKTKVIVAAHLFGMPCDIQEILKIAALNGIKLIEDCAQALGTELISDGKAGTFGDGAFFSFDTSKAINTFGGGMVVTNDDKVARDIRKEISLIKPSFRRMALKILNNYAEVIALKNPVNNFTLGLMHRERLYNFIKRFYRKARGGLADLPLAFSNIQAVIGLKQLGNLDRYLEFRKKVALQYIQKISSLENIIFGRENIDYLLNNINILKKRHLSTFHNFVILVKNAKRISTMLAGHHIDTGSQGEILENCGKIYNPSQQHPITELVVENSLELPMYSSLKEGEIDYIIRTLERVT